MFLGFRPIVLKCTLCLVLVAWPLQHAACLLSPFVPARSPRLGSASAQPPRVLVFLVFPRSARRTARTRLLAMAETEYGGDSYRVSAPAPGASSPLGTDVPTRTEGSKAGFSVIADWGTAEHVKLPADCAASNGSAPPQVKLSLLLMLLDPVRFPSPSAAKKKVRQGVVLVNGRKGRIDMLITIGKDRITMQSRTESRFKPLGDPPFHINVLYEDDVMAVVHKPPGVCTHPPKGLIVPQTQVPRANHTTDNDNSRPDKPQPLAHQPFSHTGTVDDVDAMLRTVPCQMCASGQRGHPLAPHARAQAGQRH